MQTPPAENLSRPSALLGSLLPPGVATAELAGEGDAALLLEGERHLLERAAPARAREFAAGRLCARRAAARFGFVDVPIVAGADRRPQWPGRLTGSITHTDGFSAAAVGDRRRFRAIGIDAERLGRVSRDLWSHVLVPAEADWIASLPAPLQTGVATLIFSAKEAFYKCQYEVTQQWLEFKDVTLDFLGRHPDGNSFVVRPVGRVRLFEDGGAPAVVRFAITRDLVLTAMTIAAH